MSDLGDIDKTLRSGDADHDMTLRPADSADKTLRTEQQKDCLLYTSDAADD